MLSKNETNWKQMLTLFWGIEIMAAVYLLSLCVYFVIKQQILKMLIGFKQQCWMSVL